MLLQRNVSVCLTVAVTKSENNGRSKVFTRDQEA